MSIATLVRTDNIVYAPEGRDPIAQDRVIEHLDMLFTLHNFSRDSGRRLGYMPPRNLREYLFATDRPIVKYSYEVILKLYILFNLA
jgi:hypothetical protein